MNGMIRSFFSNVSHEFRTPLTMISGPVAQLCGASGLSEEQRELLRIVQRSTDRMLELVNQQMDFGKLENDLLRLRVCRRGISRRGCGLSCAHHCARQLRRCLHAQLRRVCEIRRAHWNVLSHTAKV